MKCLYVYFITISVILVSAAVPRDLCDTCVPTQDCPLFENLNITDQLKWMEKFPCGSLPKTNDFEVPAGFASAAKGDYVCCSHNIWGVESLQFGLQTGHDSLAGSQSHKPKDDSKSNPSKGPPINNYTNNNINDRTYNNEDYSRDNNNPTNNPKNEESNYYHNKYNNTKQLENNNKNNSNKIDLSNNNLGNYNLNVNYESNQSTPINGTSKVWYPGRNQNYDNTDYWLTHNPENGGFNNNGRYWNGTPGREDTRYTQRPPGNEAGTPTLNNPYMNYPPVQYDPPGNIAGQPNQYYPPANDARPPSQYIPPGYDGRPPVQNNPPGNINMMPIQNNPPGNIVRPPVQYDPPGNMGRPPIQYNPPEFDVRPPLQNNPPGNIATTPIQFIPPGNEATLPIYNNPPGNIVRPPVQYDPPGNMGRPPFNYDTPENFNRPPFPNMPPGHDTSNPPQYYGPEHTDRPPNHYHPPGNWGPRNENFGRGNMGTPPTYFPPANNNFMPDTSYTNNPQRPYYNNEGNTRNDNNYNFNNNNPYNTGYPYNYQDNNLASLNIRVKPNRFRISIKNNVTVHIEVVLASENLGPRFGAYYLKEQTIPGNVGNGQCRITSFPPDPQSDCCGRQLADDDRIADWNNNPAYTNQWAPRRSGPIWRSRRSTPENDTDVIVENRISGGHATELYQYPWTVLLLTTFKYAQKESAFNCGGGLISAKYVLTAGHCVYDKDASVKSVQVNLAEYDKQSYPKDCKSTRNGRRCIDNVRMYVEEIISHPQYGNENLVNDIALLRLRGSVPYTDYIRPICLPTINIDEPQFSDLQFEVAGWGRVGPYSSNIKQSTFLHLVNHKECKRYYPQLTNKHLCAAGKRGEDTCKGDSGGPLMILYRGKYYVAGIVSGKRADSPCGTSVPSLYTNVYHYVSWIQNIIRN